MDIIKLNSDAATIANIVYETDVDKKGKLLEIVSTILYSNGAGVTGLAFKKAAEAYKNYPDTP